jgi:hypothetical protein
MRQNRYLSVGFGGGKIHACKNDCILYHGTEYEDLEKCSICALNRFHRRKDGGDDENCNKNRRKGGPKKVFWYFPMIPHFKHWFANKESELLRWHKEKHKQDAKMIRHYVDATQWQNIDSRNPEFAIDLRNIRITMITDDMNPFMSSSTHSTWTIVLMIFNLPSWLRNCHTLFRDNGNEASIRVPRMFNSHV